MTIFGRVAYGFILKLHPREFRNEFGAEMLWIFDEQMRSGEDRKASMIICAPLLRDAIRSAFIQRALREQQQPRLRGPQFSLLDSSAGTSQIAQGGFIAFSGLFSAFSIAACLHMVISNF